MIIDKLIFPTFSMTIDFDRPELSHNKLVELTLQVEKECPVAKYFNISGIGEGIVWKCSLLDSSLWFKVKGELHSVTKVSSIAAIDIEKIENIKEFVELTVTDNRLNQGIEYMEEMHHEITMKNIGT